MKATATVQFDILHRPCVGGDMIHGLERPCYYNNIDVAIAINRAPTDTGSVEGCKARSQHSLQSCLHRHRVGGGLQKLALSIASNHASTDTGSVEGRDLLSSLRLNTLAR